MQISQSNTAAGELIYDIHWELAGELRAPDSAILAPSHVLYTLVGRHLVYGPGSLLYIGKTERDGVGSRLLEHHKCWASQEADLIEVRVATIGEFSTWDEWSRDKRNRYDSAPLAEIVRAAEALLIYAHQPAYNSQGLVRAPVPKTAHLRIFNTGHYGMLLPELSTRRFADVQRPSPNGES